MTNAQRQPHLIVIQGTIKGVRIAPRFDPALKIPVASERSFLGNHSATVLRLAGKRADSPKPRAARRNKKLPKDRPIACAIDARLQNAIDSAYPSRVPMRSINHPIDKKPMA